MDYRSNYQSSSTTVLPLSRLRHAARQIAESAVRLSRGRRPPWRPAMDRQTRRDDQYGQGDDEWLDASRLRKCDLGPRPQSTNTARALAKRAEALCERRTAHRRLRGRSPPASKRFED